MPERAEVIARAPDNVRNAQDLLSIAPEHGHAGTPTLVRAITHVLREARAHVTHHGKYPAPAGGKLLLDLGRIGARYHKCGPGDDMLMHPVVAVGPKRAGWTG